MQIFLYCKLSSFFVKHDIDAQEGKSVKAQKGKSVPGQTKPAAAAPVDRVVPAAAVNAAAAIDAVPRTAPQNPVCTAGGPLRVR
jgi:hypothetical protein